MSDRRDDIIKKELGRYSLKPQDIYFGTDAVPAAIKNAMDENGRQMCLELLEYMAKNGYNCFWMEDDEGNPRYIFSKNCGREILTKEQLFENFL